MPPRSICLARALAAALAVVATAVPAAAQYGSGALAAPGERVAVQMLASEGGPVGKAIAPLVGVRPVLVVYWRPGDGLSERALASAAEAQRTAAPDAVLVPVAVVAAGQKAQRVQQRLGELGLRHLPGHRDAGSLARLLGVRRVPTFVLLDASGVLRLIGGSDIGQQNEDGVSILDALVRASRGAPVPTLGVLAARPIYQLLGREIPRVALTELDGKTWRSVSEYLEPDKKVLLFYWSPVCPHCVEALPKLRAWHARSRPDDVLLVDVARGDSARLRREALALVKDDPWIHLLDVDHSAARKLLVTETPTSLLLDGEGEVLSVQVGGEVDWSAWVGAARSSAQAAATR